MELIKITGKELIEAVKAVNGKKAASWEQAILDTPLRGQIYKIDLTPRNYNGSQYYVALVQDENGVHIGEISLNRFLDTKVIEGDIIVVKKEGDTKGKGMLKPHNLSDISKLGGANMGDRLANLVGKWYTMKRVSGSVPKDYTKIFTANVVPIKADGTPNPTAAQKKALWDNTVVSDRLAEIVID